MKREVMKRETKVEMKVEMKSKDLSTPLTSPLTLPLTSPLTRGGRRPSWGWIWIHPLRMIWNHPATGKMILSCS